MNFYRRIEIEDDSDCATCTARNESEWEMLKEVRCDCLDGVACPECGREVSIFVEAGGDPDERT